MNWLPWVLFGVAAIGWAMAFAMRDAGCEDCGAKDEQVAAAERDATYLRQKVRDLVHSRVDVAAKLVDAQASLALYRAPAAKIEQIMHDLKHGFADEDFPPWFLIGTRANPILTSSGDSARYSEIEEFTGGDHQRGEATE